MFKKFYWAEYDSLLWFLFRLLFKYWNYEKIILKVIEKEHKIVGVKLPSEFKTWKDYIQNTPRWYSKYEFANVKEEIRLYKYYYRIMKLHSRFIYFEDDISIIKEWPMMSLGYVFCIHMTKYDTDNYKIAEDFREKYPRNKIFWKVLEFILNMF
jgi:hypothetical protein